MAIKRKSIGNPYFINHWIHYQAKIFIQLIKNMLWRLYINSKQINTQCLIIQAKKHKKPYKILNGGEDEDKKKHVQDWL